MYMYHVCVWGGGGGGGGGGKDVHYSHTLHCIPTARQISVRLTPIQVKQFQKPAGPRVIIPRMAKDILIPTPLHLFPAGTHSGAE